jgi:phage terminase Nu1 subunit (DNA packaging protein)
MITSGELKERRDKAKADYVETRNAIAEGELISRKEVTALMTRIGQIFTGQFLVLPRKQSDRIGSLLNDNAHINAIQKALEDVYSGAAAQIQGAMLKG